MFVVGRACISIRHVRDNASIRTYTEPTEAQSRCDTIPSTFQSAYTSHVWYRMLTLQLLHVDFNTSSISCHLYRTLSYKLSPIIIASDSSENVNGYLSFLCQEFTGDIIQLDSMFVLSLSENFVKSWRILAVNQCLGQQLEEIPSVCAQTFKKPYTLQKHINFN